MEPIPGGFPSTERHARAGQIRVTSGALAKITADPAAVLGPLVGGSSSAGKIVVDALGGKLEVDLNTYNVTVLTITPQDQGGASNNGRLHIVAQPRLATLMNQSLKVSFSGANCDVAINTNSMNGSIAYITVTLDLDFTQDTTAGTTRIEANGITIENLEQSDLDISGGGFCVIGNFIPVSFLVGLIQSQIGTMVEDGFCKGCTTVADCSSPFATACNSDGQCEKQNGDCLQELGLSGRLRGSTLFASISPGTTGAMDLYEVAGGYSTTQGSGISLGLLGGMLPGGEARDRCGPPAAAPPDPNIVKSTFFQGNTRPDNAAAFDVGIGLHKSQLDALAYSGYDGGLFCLTIGSSTVAQLSTDTISLLSRSLANLVDTNAPMAVGVRPQSPPAIVLGKNTFKDDGNGSQVPDDALLDIKFTGLEIDFFASIDEQYIRVFTVVTDVHLPIGLQTTTMGELTPVIGVSDDAFTNVTVKNSDAITESPDMIAGLFPTLLNLVLPQLSGGLSPIALPELGGLSLSVTDVTAVGDTGTDTNKNFLAIFANLVPTTMPRLVDTNAELTEVYEPAPPIARNPAQWRGNRPPGVRLDLTKNADNLEFSWRLNRGSWSGWSSNRHPMVSSSVFWLPGLHKLEVRAREIGHPETLDPTPVQIELAMGTDVDVPRKPGVLGFHGQAGAGSCSCETGSPTSGVLFALVLGGLVLVPRRRRARKSMKRARRLGLFVWLAAIASLPGCSCGSEPCGDQECLDGEVTHGMGGRFTSIAGDDKRVMVATYEVVLGDLVVVDATQPADLKYKVADGVPDETPVYDPDTYRGGIEGPGDNVGAWTSIALEGHIARVAYQNRDTFTLKYAYEEKTGGKWKSYDVDGGDVKAGQYASMVIDADHKPAIAYLAIGVDDGAGHRNVELRLARAGNTNPEDPSEWTHHLIASAPGSCGGLCGSQTCVVGVMPTDPQSCVSETSDCGTSCSDTEACVMGACREVVEEPKVASLPGGTGLYVSLVTLIDGRLAAAYYDMARRALVLAVEGSRGGNDFTETVLDGNATGKDRGMWTAAIVEDGVVHIAYQDALGDQLFYTSWNAGTPGAIEVVDDGVRNGDRTHNVGAGTAIYMNGGSPVIAYQDGLVADTMLATRAGGTWTTTAIASGPLLDGFSVAATTGHGSPVIAWGTMDPAEPFPNLLTVGGP